MPILPLQDPEPERREDAAVLPAREPELRDVPDENSPEMQAEERDDAGREIGRGFGREPELGPGRLQLRSEARSLEPRGNAPRGSAPAEGVDDNTLLQRVQMGVEESLGKLYDQYGGLVYSVALRVLLDPTAAEDVLCDLFLDVWRNTDNYLAVRGPLAGWLAVSARNRAIDALRRKRAVQTLEDLVPASDFDLSRESERTMLMEKARSVIHALPVEQRKTLEMAFFDGLTHVEIAEMSGEGEDAVRGRLRQVLLTLRKAMQA